MLRNLRFAWPCEFFPVSQETSKIEVLNNYCVVGSAFLSIHASVNVCKQPEDLKKAQHLFGGTRCE